MWFWNKGLEHREIMSGAPMWFWDNALEHPCVGTPPPCWSAGELA